MKTVKLLDIDVTNAEQVEQSLYDLFEVSTIVESQLQDGFQWTDMFQFINAQDEIMDIVNDFPTFLSELKTAGSTNIVVAVNEAANRHIREGKVFGKVTIGLINIFYLLATTYKFAEKTYLDALQQYKDLQGIFSGDLLVPALPPQA